MSLKLSYAAVDALDLFGDVAQPLDDRVGVDVAQDGVVAGLTFGLTDQVLPARVRREQVPLLPPTTTTTTTTTTTISLVH